jgi:2-phospho-L-lactate transferase/gluconeogenesis factor (CofD/UPF0052 family)
VIVKPTIAALLVLTAMLFNSCGVIRRPVKVETTPITHRGEGWVASEPKPDTFLVIAANNQATAEAIKELCSKEYICFGPETVGEALALSRLKKERK